MQSQDAQKLADIYTIGHSNHPIEQFLDLLDLHHINTVADVRSQPYSRRHPQYSRNALREELGGRDIRYCFLGKELGGKPSDPSLIGPDGKPDWGRMAETEAFQIGLRKLKEQTAFSRVAILCAEEDPSRCHRRHHIARVLHEEGVHILHIRSDGAVETEARVREREAAGAEGQLLLF
jgi:uncharacterized protein (DUF488 family)